MTDSPTRVQAPPGPQFSPQYISADSPLRLLMDSIGSYLVPADYDGCTPLEDLPEPLALPLRVFLSSRPPLLGRAAEPHLGPAFVIGKGLQGAPVLYTTYAPPLDMVANLTGQSQTSSLRWGVGYLWEYHQDFPRRFAITHYRTGPEPHPPTRLYQRQLEALAGLTEHQLHKILGDQFW